MYSKEILEKYANLIVKTGAQCAKRSTSHLRASLDAKPLALEVVKEAYKAGAKSVRVDWGEPQLVKIHFDHQSLETLTEIPEWLRGTGEMVYRPWLLPYLHRNLRSRSHGGR
jgi:aminopeptidase